MRAEFVKRLRQDAIDAGLHVEAKLQRHFVRLLRTLCYESGNALLKTLVQPNPNAASTQETRRYWEWGMPDASPAAADIREFLESIVDDDCQPVFAAISLSTLSTNPTVFVPLPYGDAFDAEAFKDALWVNPPAGPLEPRTAEVAEAAARSISHTLANISYSVRLDDEPILGWLGWAHNSRAPVYVPRTMALAKSLELKERESEVVSVLQAEESFLGMASVLYLPLEDLDAPVEDLDTPEDNAAKTPAVLMLWSPIPGRWDRCFEEEVLAEPRGGGSNAAFRLRQFESPDIRSLLWEQFSLFFAIADRDFSGQRRAELELFGFIFTVESWIAQQTTVANAQFRDHFGGTLKLLHQLESGEITPTPVRTWIDALVRAPEGFVKRLVRRWDRALTDCPLHLRTWQGDRTRLRVYRLGDRDADGSFISFLGDIAPDLCIRFDEANANYIAAEPSANIAKHAERLDAIKIDVTKKFVTVRYLERPARDKEGHFVGSPGALKNYYAARRGLATARDDGSGSGLWLYHLLEARTQVFRKLYVSADGETWYTEITVPTQVTEP